MFDRIKELLRGPNDSKYMRWSDQPTDIDPPEERALLEGQIIITTPDVKATPAQIADALHKIATVFGQGPNTGGLIFESEESKKERDDEIRAIFPDPNKQ